MKTLINLKLLLGLLFFLNLQSTILNQLSFNLFAQDPELFEHTWYFVNGELMGEEFFPTPNLTAQMTFDNQYLDIGYPYCSGGISFEELNHISNVSFEITGDYYILVDECNFPKNEAEYLFMANHDRVFGDFTGSTTLYFNPFTYNIETVDGNFQLTIENGEGGWAVYNSVLLSTNSFYQNSFILYPNPVEETLFVNNTFNQQVQVNVYGVSGKLLQSHLVEAGLSQIDVNHLHAGLYFVVFENENGERVSKKFVKQ
jgi:hypothetical protein